MTDTLVGSYRSKVGERLTPFLVTSVAVLVAMVKLVVFISLGRVRAKPYIGMTRLEQILQDSTASVASTAPAGSCNYTRECNALYCDTSRVMLCNWTRQV